MVQPQPRLHKGVAMPAWLITALLRFVLPVVIDWLRKEGHFNSSEALIAKGATAIVSEVRDLKTYTEYPNDPPAPTGTTNMTTGDGTPVT